MWLLAKDCGVLSQIMNGEDVPVSYNPEDNTEYQSVAGYTCNKGYDLVGVTTRTCLADGTWSDEEPTCQRKNFFSNGKDICTTS